MDAALTCPSCHRPMEAGESFCSKCGVQVKATPEGAKEARDHLRTMQDKQQSLKKIGTGRGWILAVSILTLIGGGAMYAVGRAAAEKEIAKAEANMAHLTPEERDAAIKESIGMTWAEAVAHDRGQLNVLLVVNLILAVVYLGLWWWARSNPFAAALVALFIFLTTQGIGAVIEPKTLVQGVLMKILIIAGLGSAVSGAYKYQKLQKGGSQA